MNFATGHKYWKWRESDYSDQLHLQLQRWPMGNPVMTYKKELYVVYDKKPFILFRDIRNMKKFD